MEQEVEGEVVQVEPLEPSAVEVTLHQMLRAQGVWAVGCGLYTCGPTTGHFTRPIAFCDSEATARFLASGITPPSPSKD
jgi:hypothetical protein